MSLVVRPHFRSLLQAGLNGLSGLNVNQSALNEWELKTENAIVTTLKIRAVPATYMATKQTTL